jgi:hypothetical protein
MGPGQTSEVGVSVVAHKLLLTGTPVDHPFKVAGSS